MKLVIQIPCYNEAKHLPATLRTLPRHIEGTDQVIWLVIDDGSADGTAELALAEGADYVVSHTQNRGLAKAFETGIDTALRLGADIIVNTDADNQYCADDIPKLVAPILRGEADFVIGQRPIWQTGHFSFAKKCLQYLGSLFIRLLSGTPVRDAPSGFRAISRAAAFKLNVLSAYTYTLETIVQAGCNQLRVISVPIRTNGPTRPSRLIRNVPNYVVRSALTMIRTFVTYRPFRTFALPGVVAFSIGLAIGIRFVLLFLAGQGGGHVQSLILAALLLGIGFFLCVIASVVDLLSVNRQLMEATLERVRRLEIETPPDRLLVGGTSPSQETNGPEATVRGEQQKISEPADQPTS